MTSRYPIEALLRPPVEFVSVAVASTAAWLAWSAPALWMTTAAVGRGAAVGLLCIAAVRLRQGLRVVRFQRNLRRLPDYRLRPAQIPVSTIRLFLGTGFRWTQLHTRRLADTRQPEARPYVEPGRWYRWARSMETVCEHHRLLYPLTTVTGKRAWWNPLAPLPPVGGDPALHGVEPEESAVYMPLADRVGHILVLGTTRVGKTRLGEVLITQDIHRGEVVIVFDPKGDPELVKRVFTEAKRAGRERDFTFFHLGFPELSARYNAVGEFARITEVATRIANQLPSEGNSAAFREFAWRFVNIIARALVALGRRPDYHQIRQHITDIEPLFVEYARDYLRHHGPNEWANGVATLRLDERQMATSFRGRGAEAIRLYHYVVEASIHEPVLDGLVSGAIKYDRTYFDKIVASVGPLMEKLTSGKVAELISPDYFDLEDPRPLFDWLQAIRKRGIVYVGLDALSDPTVAAAVGNSMFADLTSVAGRLYKHGPSQGLPELPTTTPPRIAVHADEFNELIGDEFVPLLNKAGGAGFQVTCYTQTWSDIEVRLESRAKANQVAGNLNTLIVLRVLDEATATLLTEKLPEVEVRAVKTRSGATDSSLPETAVDFVSTSVDDVATQRVPLLTPADLISLPKGQAFALLEGGQLYKLRLPLIEDPSDSTMPPTLQAALATMARRSTSAAGWWRD
ncbi:MAG: type IV conjugative transfer system coupling protein TraD [Gammaproteobacteria bacterium]